MSDSLEAAGFDVTRVLDPDPGDLQDALVEFRRASADADLALLYTTGHGVEFDGVVYLLPGTFDGRWTSLSLSKFGIPVTELATSLQSGGINLVFYAGCRNNPLPSH